MEWKESLGISKPAISAVEDFGSKARCGWRLGWLLGGLVGELQQLLSILTRRVDSLQRPLEHRSRSSYRTHECLALQETSNTYSKSAKSACRKIEGHVRFKVSRV